MDKLEVGTSPSRVRHHLVMVNDDVALAFTINAEETDPGGTDAHETVGMGIATVNVVDVAADATDRLS